MMRRAAAALALVGLLLWGGSSLALAGDDHPPPSTYPTTTHEATTTAAEPTTTEAEPTTSVGTNPVTVPTLPTTEATTTTVEGSPTSVERKVLICHLPPGNPPNFQIIEIALSALPAHLAHGDIFPVPASGICLAPPTTVPGTTTVVGTNPLTVPTGPTTSTLPGTTTTLPGATTTLPGGPTTVVGTNPLTVPTGPTTTTLPGAPTTPPVNPDLNSLDIGSAASVCSRDVPFIDITFGNQPQFNGLVGTITFATLDGDFVEVVPVTYEANATVRLLYPGASVDPVTGEATDWPGWLLNDDGFWVLDPSDAEFRDGLTVTATLPLPVGGLGQSRLAQAEQVVTATTTITYPPETEACSSPEGPFAPGGATSAGGGTLPATGRNLGLGLLLAGLLGLLGLGLRNLDHEDEEHPL